MPLNFESLCKLYFKEHSNEDQREVINTQKNALCIPNDISSKDCKAEKLHVQILPAKMKRKK